MAAAEQFGQFLGELGHDQDTELLAALTNVQSIDFTANNVNASVSLSGSQISQMAGGAANTLTMQINGGDTVNITDPASNYDVEYGRQHHELYDLRRCLAHQLVAHLSLVA